MFLFPQTSPLIKKASRQEMEATTENYNQSQSRVVEPVSNVYISNTTLTSHSRIRKNSRRDGKIMRATGTEKLSEKDTHIKYHHCDCLGISWTRETKINIDGANFTRFQPYTKIILPYVYMFCVWICIKLMYICIYICRYT